MASFLVSIPATMSIDMVIEADSAEEAIRKGFEIDFRIEVTEGKDSVDIGEFEMHEKITSGNVFHGVLNQAHAEEER